MKRKENERLLVMKTKKQQQKKIIKKKFIVRIKNIGWKMILDINVSVVITLTI